MACAGPEGQQPKEEQPNGQRCTTRGRNQRAPAAGATRSGGKAATLVAGARAPSRQPQPRRYPAGVSEPGESENEPQPAPGPARNVALISDGNGRWAKARGLSVSEGHEAAADTVIARTLDAKDLGVEQLTVYSFSTENWSRPAQEVDALIALLGKRIESDTPGLEAAGIRIRFIGRRESFSTQLAERMRWAEALTEQNTAMTLFVAFNYGGRAEILDAARRFRTGGEDEFRRLLYAPEMRDPDVLIRTGRERRLSNFLLWQSAYSELVFRKELWPDFTCQALQECLAEYTRRKRRFGGRS